MVVRKRKVNTTVKKSKNPEGQRKKLKEIELKGRPLSVSSLQRRLRLQSNSTKSRSQLA